MRNPVKLGLVSVCLAALLVAQQQQPQTQRPQQQVRQGTQAPPSAPEPPVLQQGPEKPPDFTNVQPIRMGNAPAPAPAQVKPPEAKPSPAVPATTPGAPPPAGTPDAAVPGQQPPTGVTTQPAQTGSPVVGGMNLRNASLVEVVDQLARMLKINYILDPRVKGGVYLNTYGDVKGIDARNLLDLILRINGAAMVKVGDLYRIVPVTDLGRMPLPPDNISQSKDIPEDDQPMLNLVFLKYATVDELAKVLQEFIGEGARMITYAPANLMFIMDSRRQMRRTMDLISMFDSDVMTNQRVRLFEVKNGRATDIANELGTILKSMSLAEKSAAVRFLPVDRINTIIAVAPNPGAFDTIENWIKKLDIPVKSTGGLSDNYVYRVRYQRAECLAMSLMQLYGSFYGGPGYGMGGYGMGGMGYGMGLGMMGMGGYGMGMMGGGYGGYGAGASIGGANSGLGVGAGCGGMSGMMGMGMMGGGYGMSGYGMGMGGYGMPGYGMGGYGMGGYPGGYAPQYPITQTPFGPSGAGAAGAAAATGQGAATPDLTGSYLGAARSQTAAEPMPRIVPNPMDNSLLIQATPNQYGSIMKLLTQLDIPPRQILLEAKIYEVSLTGAFASGVSAFLQKVAANGQTGMPSGTRQITGALSDGVVQLSAGALIGASRELLGFLALKENATRARVVSAPSLIATDSIPASITVGNEVPTLQAQTAGSVQVQGNSTFTQSIQSRQTGVTLNVMAHINPSGIVTLIINQEVSAPQPPAASSAIQSPSFSKRSVQTQITMQDGDTIAIGGIINESSGSSSAGIPQIHKIPILGMAFGSKSYSKDRTELIVFMTPRVIYDNNDLTEASDELKTRLRMLKRYVRE